MLFDMSDIERKDKSESCGSVKTKGKNYEKIARRKTKLNDAFPQIAEDQNISFVSGGEWSTHDLIEHMIKFTGKAKLTACTWSVSNPGLEKLMIMMENDITETHFLLDWRIHQRGKDVAVWMKSNCTSFKTSNCHAKVTVMEGELMSLVIVGSANWTNNPRIEAGFVSTCRETVDFHKKWILEEINGKDPVGMN